MKKNFALVAVAVVPNKLPVLLEKIPNTIQGVLADGTYDTQRRREAIAKKMPEL